MCSLVTLTTDFGAGSSYVAAMKGALLSVNPAARLLDLSHRVPAQNLVWTSYFLMATVPYFPPETLHVIVVDPGVGSDRALLCVDLRGQRLLVPDNGCWTALTDVLGAPERVIQLAEPRYWRPQVSATFHGRDIFAPVAGHLSTGLDPALLGPAIDQWQVLSLPQPARSADALTGEIVLVDDFGNLISNIPGAWLRAWETRPLRITLGTTPVARQARTYAEAAPGEPLALVSSLDTVEIAVNRGHAAGHFNAAAGTPLSIRPQK